MALSRWPNQFIIICLFSLVQAYTIFETNCSAPDTTSNFVSSPNTRGTLDILWSSLFTIFACTWSVQHPNLPEQQQQQDVDDHASTLKGWRARACPAWKNAKWGLKGFYRSTLRMLWTSIAPELLVVAACNELIAARSIFKRMKNLYLGEEETWSLTHSYYANMGGFVVRNPLANKTIYHDPYHLTGEEFLQLRKRKHITKLPDIAEAEIKDKSKGDILGKSIALGQIVWSIIQIIARVMRKLPVSPLEVAVVAFAVCAILTYILYWEKPQRVSVTQTISLHDSSQLYNKTGLKDSTRFFKYLFKYFLRHLGISIKQSQLHGAPISVDNTLDNGKAGKREVRVVLVVVSISAALFGGIHVVAWNFPFPSTIELIFWRCATVYTTTAPVCSVLLLFLVGQFEHSTQGLTYHLATFCLTLAAAPFFLYPIARLFIIVEMFRTLYFLPPGSFVSTWAPSVPHVA